MTTSTWDSSSRTDRKRQAITEAALTAFSSRGFVATTMDEVAAAARVSKPTIYKHFGNKEQLFAWLIRHMVESLGERLQPALEALRHCDQVRPALVALGRTWMDFTVQREFIAIRRLIIGEAARFPDLGAEWFVHGPDIRIKQLADILEELSRQGKVHVSQPLLAAQQFHALAVAAARNFTAFNPVEHFDRSAADRAIVAGVDVFLNYYGLPGSNPAQ